MILTRFRKEDPNYFCAQKERKISQSLTSLSRYFSHEDRAPRIRAKQTTKLWKHFIKIGKRLNYYFTWLSIQYPS